MERKIKWVFWISKLQDENVEKQIIYDKPFNFLTRQMENNQRRKSKVIGESWIEQERKVPPNK